MKKYKISIEKGLAEIEKLLRDDGHDVVYMGEGDIGADVAIISGVDTVFEEIENVQCMFNGKEDSEMLVINVSNLTPEEVLEKVRNNNC